jgi:hypothetical protein
MYEERDSQSNSPSQVSTATVLEKPKPTPPPKDQSMRKPGTFELPFKAFLGIMAFLVITPPSIIFFLYAISPPRPAPTLTVDVELHQFLTQKDGETVILKPGYVVVTNPTKDRWEMISLTLNNRFYFHAADSLNPGESLEVFLGGMQTKNGFHRFDETYGPVEEVTVFARQPSGSRAMREVRFDE